ncbi:hypothetical protein SMC26_35160 [Actinomadura fulvescens]|uniref:Glutamine amidotransferase type-2 domain-containing protein n=1 Tax=Actinomadura fulvescens TaxID=46160 RepID=A0ABN3QY74_9ACTN
MFGLLRSPLADHPERASDAFVTLGTLAEERGRDSAGVALLTGRPASRATGGGGTPQGHADDRRSELDHGGVRVIKGRGRFSGVWRTDLLHLLDRSPVVLGHTRWATQGSPFDLLNASPLVVPDGGGAGIVATHNGDVDAVALRERHPWLPPALGTTDSEPVFQLLARCDGAANVTDLLGSLVGRAALAWVDRARPDRVNLARAALSPLTVAVDTEQNFYWASNPRWLREVERHTAVRFASAVMLREGTYLQIGLSTASSRRRPRPRVLTRAGFMPTARAWDLDERVWTGFTAADLARDRASLRHRVVGTPGAAVSDGIAATGPSPELVPTG